MNWDFGAQMLGKFEAGSFWFKQSHSYKFLHYRKTDRHTLELISILEVTIRLYNLAGSRWNCI